MRPPWLAFSLAVVVVSVSLERVGVGFMVQAGVLGLGLMATAAGSAVVPARRAAFPDDVLFWVVSFLLGMFLLSLATFVLAQRPLFGEASLAEQPHRLWWGFACIGVLAAAGVRRVHTSPPGAPLALGAPLASVFLLLAAVITIATHINVHSTVQQDHGQSDHLYHLVYFVEQVLAGGMPPPVFFHRGLQLLLIAVEGLLGLDARAGIAAYQVVTVGFYFAIAYSAYGLARYCFGASQPLAGLADVASLLYGAIHPQMWEWGTSSYLGLYSPASTFYHNAPQVYSHGMAATGLLLIGLAWKREARTFAAGCCLLSASMYFKPSFLMYLGPALFAMLPFQRRAITWEVLAGYAVLMAAPVGWLAYPWLAGVESGSIDYEFSPFRWSLAYIPTSFTHDYLASAITLVVFATVLSFAFPLVVGGAVLAERLAAGTRQHSSFLDDWRVMRFEVLLLLFAAIAVVGGLFVVEAGLRRDFGNLTWGTASAYLGLLPWLMVLASRIRSRLAWWLAWGLFVLHILSGVRHLIRYSVSGFI